MNVLCECMALHCQCQIDIPPAEYQRVQQMEAVFVIVNGCKRGPERSDRLVERRRGYRLYRERAAREAI